MQPHDDLSSLKDTDRTDCANNLTAAERSIIIAYSGISFISFLILVATVGLHIYLYCRKINSAEYIGILLFIFSFFLMLFTLIESFQWFVILTDRSQAFLIGCMIIAVIHQYCLITLLTNITCIAIHLTLQICTPKCLTVIENERKKRYKYLMCLYLFIDAAVPLLYVPWPFTKMAYGPNGIVCCMDTSMQ